MPTPSVRSPAADRAANPPRSLEALAAFAAPQNHFVLVPGSTPYAAVLRAWPYQRRFVSLGFGKEPERSVLRVIWLKAKRGSDVVIVCEPQANAGSNATNWMADIRAELLDQFGVPTDARWWDLTEKVPAALAGVASEGVLVRWVNFDTGAPFWGPAQPLEWMAQDLKLPLALLKQLCLTNPGAAADKQ